MSFESFENKIEQVEKERKNIESIWAEIIEKGVSMDPQSLSNKRQRLYSMLYQLGAINKNGSINTSYWTDLVSWITQRKSTPLKPVDYPDIKLFKEKFDAYAIENTTETKELQRHSQGQLSEYLYGLGIIMSNKLSYETIFENDEIKTKENKIVNGKHRELTEILLRQCNYTKPMPWIKIIEED